MADVSFGVDVILNLVDKSLGKSNALTSANKQVDDLSGKLNNISNEAPKINTKAIVPEHAIIKAGIQDLQSYGKTLNGIEIQYGRGSKEANRYFTEIVKGGLASEKSLRKAQKAAKGFSFDFLGLMFGGMALDRAFGGMFRSMKEGYASVAGENDLFNKKVGVLSDSFGFLKFTMFDAFANNSIVQGALDATIWVMNKLGKLFDDYPWMGTTLLVVAGGLGAFGKALILFGSVKQFTNVGGILGTLKDMSDLNTTKLLKSTDDIDVASKSFKSGTDRLKSSKILKGIGVTAGLVLAGFSINEFVKSLKEDDIVGAVGFGIAGALGIAGAVTSLWNPILGIGLIIAGTISFAFTYLGASMRDEEKAKQDVLALTGVDSNLIETVYNTSLSSDERANLREGLLVGAFDDAVNDYITLQDKLKKLSLDSFGLDETEYKKSIKELTSLSTRLYEASNSVYGQEFMTAVNAQMAFAELNKSASDSSLTMDSIFQNIDVDDINTINNINVDEFETQLSNIKTPLADFLASFNGDLGLIKAINVMSESTQTYLDILPILKTGFNDEKGQVDNLTESYNNLASAKERANVIVKDYSTGQSTNTTYTTYG